MTSYLENGLIRFKINETPKVYSFVIADNEALPCVDGNARRTWHLLKLTAYPIVYPIPKTVYMKKMIGMLIAVIALVSCNEKEQRFAGIESGMTKEEVIAQAGEPTRKNDLAFADLWVYKEADRTIVFRADTVYDIITSAEARIDSIETSLKETGSDLKQKIDNTVDSLDSGSLRIKDKIMGDSSKRN